MTRSEGIARHLPELRRYGFVTTGSIEAGDHYVAACLEAATAAPDLIDRDDCRLALLRLFHDVNGYPPVSVQLDDGASGGSTRRMLLQLAALDREERAAVVLGRVFALQTSEIGEVLGLSDSAARAALEHGRRRLAKLALGHVLIIEDDYLIAQEIARLIEDMGQRVCGPAATFDEAMACARACMPTLVLADIQLRDGRTAGLLAADALTREHDIPLIVITGYPERLALASVRPAQVLTKPFQYAALRTAINSSLLATPA